MGLFGLWTLDFLPLSATRYSEYVCAKLPTKIGRHLRRLRQVVNGVAFTVHWSASDAQHTSVSYGNAGTMCRYANMTINSSLILHWASGMLLDPSSSLSIKLMAHLPSMLPWAFPLPGNAAFPSWSDSGVALRARHVADLRMEELSSNEVAALDLMSY